MNKEVLNQYIDACELVRETQEDIRRLQQRGTVQNDSVKGSMTDFPYIEKTFHIQGIDVENEQQIEREKELLQQRLEQAKELKNEVEAYLNTIPLRMQRIIRYKIFEQMTWEQVARKMGRRSTGESVRKEFEAFIKK
ncbi:hypothetical protein NDGK_02533 [Clostridiales bacterium CHKCI001]|nr:hypothetical protein NDGK_02533 [Clostridiales bacterium CHKCI001]